MADTRNTRTYGGNNPMHRQAAAWDGHRSVRLSEDDIGLATTAYSYKLSHEELTEAAERIALLWNLHLGVSNEELRRCSPAPVSNLQVPEGWKIVPEQPTEAMWEAGEEADEVPGDSYTKVYCAMIAAAPPAPDVEGTEFLHNLVENAFSWGKQDCNYLNPKHIEAFIGATRNGMPPEAAAAWIADGSPAPVSNLRGDYHELLMRLQAVQHATDRPYAASVAKDAGDAIRALAAKPHVGGRWRIFEAATGPGYWGIELEEAGNDDDPIMYPIKVHRDIVARIVEAHNAATTKGSAE